MYRYPLEEATNIALTTVRKWLEWDQNAAQIDLVIFGCYLSKELRCYEKWMQWYFPATITIDGHSEPSGKPVNQDSFTSSDNTSKESQEGSSQEPASPEDCPVQPSN